MVSNLDSIVWNCLSGPHARFSVGTATARRYAPGFSPIVGFAQAEEPDFDTLLPYCTPGEHFYCDIWSGTAPAGWRIEADATMFRMVWEGEMPRTDEAPESVPLGPEHAAQALDLASRMNSGPFGRRTIQLGEYFGFFDRGRLIAMAGERLFDGTFREISGVCTDPDFRGRGLATRLIRKLIYRQMRRGETPFLHVMSTNADARRLYERLGFVDYQEVVARVVAPIEVR